MHAWGFLFITGGGAGHPLIGRKATWLNENPGHLAGVGGAEWLVAHHHFPHKKVLNSLKL